MRWGIAGVIELFYGRPWTFEERTRVPRWCAERGMTHYVHAPKDDPLHRRDWRTPWPAHTIEAFARLGPETGMTVGVAISPGLSLDCDDIDGETRALVAKLDPVVAAGIDTVMLALDDLPPAPGSARSGTGRTHGLLTRRLAEAVGDRAEVLLIPEEYATCDPSDYLDALHDALPLDVAVAWTGPAVVNTSISVEDARRRAASMSGRAPLLLDNTPVNDAVMADLLPLGPLRGRDPGLAEVCCGYLANPMVQPTASLLPLASTAAWLAGDDPGAAWTETAESLGWLTLAEACDGEVPARLVEAVIGSEGPDGEAAADALEAWAADAASCTAPGLEAEAGPWIDAVHAEADVLGRALALLRLARAGAPAGEVARRAFGVAARWPALTRLSVSVMGRRSGIRPTMAHHGGDWRLLAGFAEQQPNATDRLVHAALTAAAAED